MYSNLTPKDFDRYDCVKLSKGIFVTLLFILRGYVTWIVSVTNMQDRTSTIAFFYPNPKLFYLSLASGAIGLIVAFVLIMRRPDAAGWVKWSCKYLRQILVVALIFDLIVNLAAYYWWDMQSVMWLVVNTAIVCLASWFLFTSERVKINVEEFPETLPEK